MTNPELDSPCETENAATPVSPFNLSRLREQAKEIPVRKVVLAIKVRKPLKTDFFRVHPGEDYWIDVLAYEHEEEDTVGREMYWIHPDLWDDEDLRPMLKPVRLHYCKSRRGVDFLWPIKMPVADSRRRNAWTDTALEIAERAKKQWVRMIPDIGAGCYVLLEPEGELGEPDWLPDKSFEDLLGLAFKGQMIDNPDHPVLRELRGGL